MDEQKENFKSPILNLHKPRTLERLTKFERARIIGTSKGNTRCDLNQLRLTVQMNSW